MAELLDRVREEIAARRGELEPHVEEHARLTAALAALTSSDGARARPTLVRPPVPQRSEDQKARAQQRKAPAAGKRRVARGARAEQVLGAVRAAPGIGVSALALEVGVSRPHLYSTLLPRLAQDGKIVKRDTGWHLAEQS